LLVEEETRKEYKFPIFDRYNDDISLEDAIHTSLLTLKEGFEGAMSEETIEIGVIGGQGTSFVKGTTIPEFKKLSKAEIKDYLSL
jgi:20S proteasome subunit alpha 2